MAEDPRKLLDIEKQRTAELEKQVKLAAELTPEYQSALDVSSRLTFAARDLTNEIDDVLKINRRRTADERALLDIARSITSQSSQNFELTRKSRALEKERNKLTATRSAISREIRMLEAEIATFDETTLKNRQRFLVLTQKIADEQKILDQLRIESIEMEDEALKSQIELIKARQASLDNLKEQSSELDRIIPDEFKRLAVLERAQKASENIAVSLEETFKFQKEVNRVTGITGELLEGVNRIGVRVLGGLGINLGVISEAFETGRSAMSNFGKRVARVKKEGKELPFGFERTRALAIGLTGTIKELGNIITDPAIVIGVMLSNFKELNAESVRFQRLTGQTGPILDSTLNSRLATSVQYLQITTELSTRLGINISEAFSSENLAASAELLNNMGLTADQAGQFALISEINNRNVDSTLDGVVKQINSYNKLNRTALNHGQIISEIASASDETLASLKGQPTALATAASAARRLGLQLSELESLANNLLDFESTISNELEAQLITGRQVNLSRARELALSNDLAGLGKEIFENTISTAEFAQMNRIQQESLAKSLGLSRQQLARIAILRTTEGSLTEKTLESAAGITREELQRVEAMQQLTVAIQKIGQALATPAEYLASMLSNSVAMYGVLSILGGIGLAKLITGFTKLTKTFSTLYRLARLTTLAKAVSAAFTNPAYFAAGATVAAGGVALLSPLLPKIDDGIIDPNGGLVVSGPKGSIQTNPGDYITASTNVPGSGGSRMEQLLESMLIEIKKGGNVYIDGNKAGEALVLGSYKSS